jgi:ketosteroid isomerase-like protein
MKNSILISVFFVALLFVSTFNANSQSETKDEIKAKIEKINAEMIDAMLNGDYGKSLANYSEDAVSLPSYQPMLKGKVAIKQANEAMANSGVKVTSFKVVIDKLIMSDDLIVEIGEFDMTMEIPMMDNPYNDVGKYMTVWKKQEDGSLKIQAETWNSNNNPWQGQGM